MRAQRASIVSRGSAIPAARSTRLSDRTGDAEVVGEMRQLRAFVKLARFVREQAGVKHRQPLRVARVGGRAAERIASRGRQRDGRGGAGERDQLTRRHARTPSCSRASRRALAGASTIAITDPAATGVARWSKVRRSGDRHGLQTDEWLREQSTGGFDSLAFPPLRCDGEIGCAG